MVNPDKFKKSTKVYWKLGYPCHSAVPWAKSLFTNFVFKEESIKLTFTEKKTFQTTQIQSMLCVVSDKYTYTLPKLLCY